MSRSGSIWSHGSPTRLVLQSLIELRAKVKTPPQHVTHTSMILGGFFSWLNEVARSTSVDWRFLFYASYITHTAFVLVIDTLQYSVQNKPAPPKALAEEMTIDQETFKKSQAYTKSKLKLNIFARVYKTIVDCAIIYSNITPKVWYFWQGVVISKFPSRFGDATIGILALLTFAAIGALVSHPLSLYKTFVLEEKYGFNKMTLRLYIKDTLKTYVLALVFMPPMLGAIQKIIEYTGNMFVIYIVLFGLGMNIIFSFLAPAFIMPWFSKYEPLEKGELRTAIEKLARSLNFPLTRLYVEDGSTRSAHSNAYFIGLPWYKQIVIFDTLIKEQTTEQIVAVLAHELGHWSHSHIPILMLSGLLETGVMYPALALFLGNKHFFTSLGFTRGSETPILIAVATFNEILVPLDIALQFLSNYITRVCEYDADKFAARLGHGDSLIKSLVQLNKTNLSAVEEHPLYSTYHNSHPTTPERLAALKVEVKKQQ